jgi:methyl-accepting chemotaxis protein
MGAGERGFMTIRSRLALVFTALALGIIGISAMSLWTLETVRVNGPLYDRITQGKDLLGDIMPPPAYALEPYLMALRMAAEKDAGRRDQLAQDLANAARDYEAASFRWEKEVPTGALRDAVEKMHRTGRAFLDGLDAEFLSAWRRGDSEAAQAALRRAEERFAQHRQGVLEAVKIANGWNAANEAEARAIVRTRTFALAALLLLVLVAGAAGGYWVAAQLTRGLRALAAQSDGLSAAVERGDLEHRAGTAGVPMEFCDMVRRMNGTMDAFARPLRLATEYVALVARGVIPPRVTDEYRGQFDELKRNLNKLIEMMERRAKDLSLLLEGAKSGQLSTRADASAYEGESARVIADMNSVLETVSAPLADATRALGRLAHRDLTARMTTECNGEYARMKEAVNATAEALHDAIAQVARSIGQVSSAASQIASSSQAVASGASEQASSLEETGSSLESMSSMTKQAADNAQQAAALASAASGAATEGSAAMEQMTGAMVRIKASAEGTSQIIKDINEIAFQTNLLALNAAVEAARAGEAGRGFAVVAEEVRSLALRSKEAATKTEELIRQSVREATDGEVTAGHVNERLSEIVGSVAKVTGIVAEIAATAREQASGIEQLNRAVGQMNSVTQQNAASSEESSSAAAELSGQAEELATMVELFQLQSESAGIPGEHALAPQAWASLRVSGGRCPRGRDAV